MAQSIVASSGDKPLPSERRFLFELRVRSMAALRISVRHRSLLIVPHRTFTLSSAVDPAHIPGQRPTRYQTAFSFTVFSHIFPEIIEQETLPAACQRNGHMVFRPDRILFVRLLGLGVVMKM